MSWNAQRFIGKKELVERDRIKLAFHEEELQKQSEVRIFCIFGDIWDSACATFPSLLCPEDDHGAYEKEGVWHTYSSGRQVCRDGAPMPWVCFGQSGSLIAATEMIANMQGRLAKGRIEFVDGTRMDVHDYLLPEWAQKGTWYRHNCGYSSYYDERSDDEKQARALFDDWYEEAYEIFEEAREEAYKNFEPIGSGYYESRDPNDFLFYTDEMIDASVERYPSQEVCDQKMQEFREQARGASPYALEFAKALQLV